jgi:ribonuclease E
LIPFPAPEPAEVAAEAPRQPETVEEVWVELPAPAEEPPAKPARARRSRAKAKVVAEPTEAAVAESVSAAPAAEQASVAPVETTQPEPAVAVEAEESVLEPAAQPLGEPTRPAGEISSPPEKPKRGWWRRSG